MTYDLGQAYAKLSLLTLNGPTTRDALIDLVRNISTEAKGGVTVLYSGIMSDGVTSSSSIVQNLISSGADVRLLDNSDAGKFLKSDAFLSAVADAYHIKFDELFDVNFKSPAKDWLSDPVSGPWADVSRRFAAASSGDVRVIAPEGDKLRIFAQTELPELLKNPNVSHIDGIPRAQLVEVLERQGLAAVQEFTFNHARLKTELSGILKGDIQKYLSLTPDAYAEVLKDPVKYKAVDAMFDGMSAARKDAFRSSMRVAFYVGEDMAAKGLSKVANKLGPLGVMAGFLLAANSASAAEAAGQPEKAKEIMSEWAVDSVGSSAGEIVGGAIGGIALTALAAWGLTVSAPVIGAVMIGATLLGGIFGGDAVKGIYDLAKDLDANGRKDLLDKLGKLVFGTNFSITSPLPADLNGERLTLDTTVSREDIVANAKVNIAWRYAVRELNPFVIPDISYEQHNLDGSLDLYDSVTGKGRMTESYLQDRAAMLTWLIRINKLDQTELKSLAVGDEAWAFRDVDSGRGILVLPDKLLSSTAPRHYVTFGGNAADALSGAELSDHLYGGAGDDTLTGFSGQDYLEGGLGKDTYVVDSSGGGDWILDSDGQGVVKWSIGGAQYLLAGGKKMADGTWKSVDGRFIYSLVLNASGNKDLNVIADGAVLRVRNFTSGQLGVVLDGAENPKAEGVGTAGNDRINQPGLLQANGLAGNDLMEGALDSSGEWFDGGDGRDLLFGRAGNDTLLGGAGDDMIVGGNGADLIDGGSGRDNIVNGTRYIDTSTEKVYDNTFQWAGAWTSYAPYWEWVSTTGSSLVFSDPHSSILDASWKIGMQQGGPASGYGVNKDSSMPTVKRADVGADTIFGGAGDDVIGGSGGDDLIDGGLDNDLIIGGVGNEKLLGGQGNDEIAGNEGRDLIVGGEGRDSLYGGVGDDSVFGSSDADSIHGDFGFVAGLDSTLYAHSGEDLLSGGDGNDSLYGDGGADSVFGDAGNDQLNGDDFSLAVEFHGKDMLDGGDGDDTLFGMGDDDELRGGDGADFLFGDNFGESVIAASAQGNDWLDGGAGDDELVGNGGNDTLIGGAGVDILIGGAGDDVYVFSKDEIAVSKQATAETIIDDAGTDTLLLDGMAREDTFLFQLVNEPGAIGLGLYSGEAIAFSAAGPIESIFIKADLGSGAAVGTIGGSSVSGGSESQWGSGYVKLSEAELFSRNPFSSRWIGTANADAYYGGKNKDTLTGGGGNDSLVGNGEDDYLDGGGGDDELIGGAGNDYLRGGDGRDVYRFEIGFGQDTIMSPSMTDVGGDRIIFSSEFDLASALFYRSGGDLIVTLSQNDRVTLEGYFREGAASRPIDFIDFSKFSLNETEVLKRVQGGPNSIYRFGSQNDDYITASSGVMNIEFGYGGNDFIRGAFYNQDEIHGGDGDDTLFGDSTYEYETTVRSPEGGEAKNMGDHIFGDDGNDKIYGCSGADTLEGGKGNDFVSGGKGSDVYVVNVGDGFDTINNLELTPTDVATDVIQFGEGISPSDITLLRVGKDLVFQDKEGRFGIVLQAPFAALIGAGGGMMVDKVRFSNGEVWDQQAIWQRVNYSTEGDDAIVLDPTLTMVDAGGGDDQITGSSSGDTILGGDGNDSLIGGNGIDSLVGGGGDDVYWVSNQGAEFGFFGYVGDGSPYAQPEDIVVERPDEGVDTLISDTFSTTLPENIENLLVERMGQQNVWSYGELIHLMMGNHLDNRIDVSRVARSDSRTNKYFLDGNGGRDTLIGGAGDEVYIVDSIDDVVIERGVLNGGEQSSYDVVYSSVSFVLPDNIEELALSEEGGFGVGNALANVIKGNGACTLKGGYGDDSYYVNDNAIVLEEVDSGFDKIYIAPSNNPPDYKDVKSGDYSLEDYKNIEGLEVRSKWADIRLFGTDAGNWLSANGLNVTILGGGGDDSISASSYSHLYVDGGSGNDYIEGGRGFQSDNSEVRRDWILVGGEGDDTISLFQPSALAIGGEGNDLIQIGSAYGFVRVGFELGGGHDQVQSDQSSGYVKVQLGSGIDSSNVSLSTSSDGLSMLLSDGSKIDIKSNVKLIGVLFSDGREWDQAALDVIQNGGVFKDGGGGNDLLDGGSVQDLIYGGDGNDSILGLGGADTLNGGGGDDQLFGDRIKATVVVLARATLAAGVGAQMEVWLDGKKIGSIVVDSTTSKTYQFSTDLDIGTEASKLDVLFTNDAVINGEDRNLIVSSVKLNGYEMKPTDPGVVLDKGAGATAFDSRDVIPGQAGLYWNGALRFAPPVNVFGTAGSDSLYGEAGNDLLDGGKGNDGLYGGAGNDTYVFGRGTGADTISEYDSSAEDTDILSVGAGVRADQLWFRKVGSDLEVSILGSSDKVTVGNWYANAAYHVEQFRTADGKILLDTQVDALVSAMAAFAPPAAGQISLPPAYQAALNPLIAANWR